MEALTDAELMHRVRDRQRPALEELYDRYVKLVYSFAMKATRDEQQSREIVQLVFTGLWSKPVNYDPEKGKFVNWLITVTRNATTDYVRSQHRQSQLARLAASKSEAEAISDQTENAAARQIFTTGWAGGRRRHSRKFHKLKEGTPWGPSE